MPKFNFDIHITGIVEISQEVIDTVDIEWIKHMYSLKSPDEIAGHIAYNMAINDIKLPQIDGFAHLELEDTHASIQGIEAEVEVGMELTNG